MKFPAVEAVPTRVNDAIGLFIQHKMAEGKRPNTIRCFRTDLERLRRVTGNIYLHQITKDHIARAMLTHVEKGNGPGARNQTISRLRIFFDWAQLTHRVRDGRADNPMATWKGTSYEVEQPPPIAHEDFPKLFDIAGERHPAYRAYWAYGLFTAARGPSELIPLRIWDLVTTGSKWSVSITRVKTRRARDPYPMPNELCIETVRWLNWYNAWAIANLGTGIKRDWQLFPRLQAAKAPGSKFMDGKIVTRLLPETSMHPAGVSKAITTPVLKEYGYPVNVHGWGGTHVLRKSGAIAIYRELCESGATHDRAIDVVKDILGHKNIAMTEHYLGLDRGRAFRDELIGGQWLFRSNDPAHQKETGVSRLHAVKDDDSYDLEGALEALPRLLESAG